MYFYAFTFFMLYVLVLLVGFYVLVCRAQNLIWHLCSSILAIKETGNHNIFQKEILWSISRNSKNNKTSRHKMARIIFSRLLQALEASHRHLTWYLPLLQCVLNCAWMLFVVELLRIAPKIECLLNSPTCSFLEFLSACLCNKGTMYFSLLHWQNACQKKQKLKVSVPAKWQNAVYL